MKQKNHDRPSLINKIENSSDRYGWLVLFIYIAVMSFITIFHEPWFDEAQSWIIARDASIKDIIFLIPHYEGHPPLWHLYLTLFARPGLPYEFGLKLASIIVNAVAMGLIIFKAPFKKIIRYLIPFTYYFFFMYGVVSRCYSFTVLGFILMAITYKDKDSKPFNYILSMMLVCASTAYGIMFCAGAAIVWLIEIAKEDKKLGNFIPRFVKDKRFGALAVLFIFAVFLILIIMPREDTFATNLSEFQNPWILRLFYMFMGAPLEASFFTPITGNYSLMYCDITPGIIISIIVMFAVLGSVLYVIGKSAKKLAILIVPYSFFAVFAGSVYFTEHHVNIIAYFLLFWLWICFDSEEKIDLPEKLKSKIPPQDMSRAKKLLWLFPAAFVGIPLYWNVVTCVMEIQVNYSSAKDIAEFITENELEDDLLMTQWISDTAGTGLVRTNINDQFVPAVLAYFDENIFYTFNDGDDSLSYNTHILPTQSEIDAAYSKWKQLGAPDILIGRPDLYSVFQDEVTMDDYTLVKVITEKRITKDDFLRLGSFVYIYARNDLVDYYEFEPQDEDYWINVLLGKEKLP